MPLFHERQIDKENRYYHCGCCCLIPCVHFSASDCRSPFWDWDPPPLSPTGNFEAAMTSYFSSGRFLTSWFVNFSSHSTEDNSSPPSHIALKTSSITSGHDKYLMIFLHRMHQWDIFAHVALLGNSSGNHAACASVSLNNVRVLKVNSRSCARARVTRRCSSVT